MNYTDRTAVLTPIIQLFKSKRFLVAFVSLVVALIVAAVPDAEPLRGELLALITVIGGVLVGGYSVTDAVAAGRERANQEAQNPQDWREVIVEVVREAISGTLPAAQVQSLAALEPVEVRAELSDGDVDRIADALAERLARSRYSGEVVGTGNEVTNQGVAGVTGIGYG